MLTKRAIKASKKCSLPLTGQGVVDRIITNLGVFDVVGGGLKVIELAPEVTMEEVRNKTEATIVGCSLGITDKFWRYTPNPFYSSQPTKSF